MQSFVVSQLFPSVFRHSTLSPLKTKESREWNNFLLYVSVKECLRHQGHTADVALGTVDSEHLKLNRLLFALYTKRMTSKKKKVDNNIILGPKILFSFPLINKMIKTK